MKCHIMGIDSKIQKALEMVNHFLKLEWDENALEIAAEKGNKIEISFLTDREIKIIWPSVPGLLRALMICRMELESGRKQDITEEIQIENCGVMLDMSRNGVMRVSAVKEFAAQMAVMGLNQLYLYMEDTYTIEGRPYFGYMRGRYSKQELREIDDFCALLGIEAIPHIQTLGHMAQYIKWDEGMQFRDTAEVLLTGEEKTYRFIEEAILSVSSCFRTNKIHLGCDEAGNLGSGMYYAKHGCRDRKEIMLDHISSICAICRRNHLKPIIYGDTLFAVMQGETYAKLGVTEVSEEFVKKIPSELKIVFWDYCTTDPEYYDKMLNAYRKLGNEVIFWGGIWTWFGFAPDNKMTIDASTPALMSCKKNGVKTAIASIWGDDGCECNYRLSVLGLQLFAEHMYHPEVSENILSERFAFFTGADYEMFIEISDFHNEFRNGEFYTKRYDGTFYVDRYYGKRFFWSDILEGFMDRDLAERPMSGHYKRLYDKITSYHSSEWEHIYAYFRNLIDFVYRKCLIAEKLYPAYQKKDKALLKEIAQEQLPTLKKKAKRFRNMHMEQWMEIYKPFGFEVLDIRYGGMCNRIDYAIERLNAYLNGTIPCIEELEEKRFLHRCEWTQRDFSSVATACYKI